MISQVKTNYKLQRQYIHSTLYAQMQFSDWSQNDTKIQKIF